MVQSKINANTAPAEVLMAALPGINRGQAQQIIQRRQAKPLTSDHDIFAAIDASNAAGWKNPQPSPSPQTLLVDVKSFHFEIFGQLRYEQHMIRERSVVFRSANPFDPIKVLRRERLPPNAT